MTTSSPSDIGAARPPDTAVPAWRTTLIAVLLAAGAGFVYLLIAGGFQFRFRQSEFPYHVYMADAMLHGQLHIREELITAIVEGKSRAEAAYLDRLLLDNHVSVTPAERAAWIRSAVLHDWALFQGRVYGYWAPLAPAVLVPWVAILGPGTSDRLVNALFGGLNVGLFYWLLCRVDAARLLRMSEPCRVGLALLLAFGTVHFYLSCAGRVWFAAQIFTLTAMLAACLAACSVRHDVKDNVWSGVFFGAAILGRNIVALTAPFFLVLIWARARRDVRHHLAVTAVRMGLFCVPCVVAVGLQAVYNKARFGSVFESGQAIQVRTGGDPQFVEDYERYGPFDLHFLARNLKYYVWNWRFPENKEGRIWFDPYGNSMFLVTPALLYMLLAWRSWNRFTFAVVCGVAPLLAALLLFRATGYYQFGNRYLLDAMPLLLLLVAAGMRGRLTHVAYVLIVLAVAANLFGTYRFCDSLFAPVRPWIGWATVPAFVAVALVIWFTIHGARWALVRRRASE